MSMRKEESNSISGKNPEPLRIAHCPLWSTVADIRIINRSGK